MSTRVFSAFLVFSVLAFSCSLKKPQFNNISGFTQGTTYSILYENSVNRVIDSVKDDVEKILHSIDMSLSVYTDSSIISRINRNEDVTADSLFTEVFNKSKEISQQTEGAFDITVGPLVRAWGFGPDEHKNFNPAKLDSLLKLVGYNKVALVDGKVVKSVPGIILDVNAIAQGYTVDVVCRYFERVGVKSYLVEIGGEVRVKGKKGNSMWRIGIDKPTDDNMSPGTNLQAIVQLKDRSLATSGNYRKFYVEDGIKYSHTIDPKTGFPARNRLLSASVIAGDCTTADGIATACMVMGLDRAKDYILKNKNLEAYFVFSDEKGNFTTWISGGLKKFLKEE
jgi:FAD:protein FMN transferase